MSTGATESGLAYLDASLPIQERVRDLVARDKKAGAGGVEFVLLEGFGRPRLREQVPAGLLEEVIAWLSAE